MPNADLRIIGPDIERDRGLDDICGAGFEMMTAESVTQALWNHAVRSPSRTFAIFKSRHETEEISYLQLLRRSLSCAEHLSSIGIQNGVVAVMLGQSPRALYWFLGAMFAGAIPTFMPPPNSKQRTDVFVADHRALFQRLNPAAMIASASVARHFDDLTVVDDDAVSIAEPTVAYSANHHDEPGRIAALQHSSGTTGLKKGVVLTHRAIVGQVRAYADALSFTSSDTIASWLPLYHDMGFIACFMMPLLIGSKVVMLDPFEWVARPRVLLEAIEAHRATLCWLPNFAFSHLAALSRPASEPDLSSVRAFINCSEPCTRRSIERFLERFQNSGVKPNALQVCYALAENVFAATQTRLGLPPKVAEWNGKETLSCGRPIAGVRIDVIGQDGRRAPDGEIGEITIQSPFLFSGYYGDDERTEKLRDDRYRTGDLGFILDDELYVTGRTDDMLIFNGRNVYAHEIEEIVGEIAGVVAGRCVAFAVEDTRSEASGLVVLAECESFANTSDIGRAVRTAINDHLGFSVYAFEVVPRGSLVKSTSGKLSRSRNRAMYLSGALSEPPA